MAELRQALRAKHDRIEEHRRPWHRTPWKYAVTCTACGAPAIVYLEPDGACGDADCCPQSSHVEALCTNLECPMLTESLT